MIKKVKIQFFKQFEDQEFLLPEHLLLAGPNNSGKTTLLQAISVWRMALDRWLLEFGSKPIPKKRSSVPITRKDFTAVPLRAMNQLWTDTSVSVKKGDSKGRKPGAPQPISITLEGEGHMSWVLPSFEEAPPLKKWELTMEFRYQSSEQIYVKPADEHIHNIPKDIHELNVVHVPPFSGISVDETRYDLPYQSLLIGQGKAGDILRNLLLEIFEESLLVDVSAESEWKNLCRDIAEIFGYTLLPPDYDGPYIRCEYLRGVPKGRGHNGLPQLDISNAGSGFHQVLLLLGFFYARPASVLLLDEPDAHLHVILQKQINDILRNAIRKMRCQLIVATHSEVLIDNTDPSYIISFAGPPHQLTAKMQRNQLRESLKRVSAQDLLSADHSKGVLYVEGETDFDILFAWAKILNHPLQNWFKEHPFCRSNHGCNPKESSAHFFALRGIKPEITGLLLLDRDNKDLESREVRKNGLVIERWNRYETENYLIHPETLKRFLHGQKIDPVKEESAMEYLRNQLPPAAYSEPLKDNPTLIRIAASKDLLPEFFEAAQIDITKNEYYLVAEQMKPDEIHDEIKEKLDAIYKAVT